MTGKTDSFRMFFLFGGNCGLSLTLMKHTTVGDNKLKYVWTFVPVLIWHLWRTRNPLVLIHVQSLEARHLAGTVLAPISRREICVETRPYPASLSNDLLTYPRREPDNDSLRHLELVGEIL